MEPHDRVQAVEAGAKVGELVGFGFLADVLEGAPEAGAPGVRCSKVGGFTLIELETSNEEINGCVRFYLACSLHRGRVARGHTVLFQLRRRNLNSHFFAQA